MRVWDQIDPRCLCRQHLLGEHREIHCIFTFITTDKGGAYKNHPEVRRWVGHVPALRTRHADLVAEMVRRGYNHKSPLPKDAAARRRQAKKSREESFPEPWDDQRAELAAKGCECEVPA